MVLIYEYLFVAISSFVFAAKANLTSVPTVMLELTKNAAIDPAPAFGVALT